MNDLPDVFYQICFVSGTDRPRKSLEVRLPQKQRQGKGKRSNQRTPRSRGYAEEKRVLNHGEHGAITKTRRKSPLFRRAYWHVGRRRRTPPPHGASTGKTRDNQSAAIGRALYFFVIFVLFVVKSFRFSFLFFALLFPAPSVASVVVSAFAFAFRRGCARPAAAFGDAALHLCGHHDIVVFLRGLCAPLRPLRQSFPLCTPWL